MTKKYSTSKITVPRFNEASGFYTTPERSKIMSKIKAKDSKPELLLRKELWKLGYRYRKNNRKIKGTPDLSFGKLKLAIFVDGEFWHGYNWAEKKDKIKSNIDFWHKKIERNIARDLEVNEHLTNAGWTVLRFWSNEIKKNLPEVIATIERHLKPQQPVQLYPQDRTDLNSAAEPPAEDQF